MPKKWPEKPLQERILWEETFRELIKLVGYAGMKLDEFRPKVQPLVDKHGLEAMKAIGELLLRVDEAEPRFVRLHPNARAFVWPLLGPDPESPPWWAKLVKPASASADPALAAETKAPKRKKAAKTL